jgi:predicted alpha/beta hydrolase family esterase
MSIWQRKYPSFHRVEQQDWFYPDRDDWIKTLDKYIDEQIKPLFLVAHSLGTITLIHWASAYSRQIAGAFLVAPPDVERADMPEEITGFVPIPIAKLNFPSLVVASENDNYISIERAQFFAQAWGSSFVNTGEAGHLNAKSGHGEWEQGERLLQQFIEQNY